MFDFFTSLFSKLAAAVAGSLVVLGGGSAVQNIPAVENPPIQESLPADTREKITLTETQSPKPTTLPTPTKAPVAEQPIKQSAAPVASQITEPVEPATRAKKEAEKTKVSVAAALPTPTVTVAEVKSGWVDYEKEQRLVTILLHNKYKSSINDVSADARLAVGANNAGATQFIVYHDTIPSGKTGKVYISAKNLPKGQNLSYIVKSLSYSTISGNTYHYEEPIFGYVDTF